MFSSSRLDSALRVRYALEERARQVHQIKFVIGYILVERGIAATLAKTVAELINAPELAPIWVVRCSLLLTINTVK